MTTETKESTSLSVFEATKRVKALRENLSLLSIPPCSFTTPSEITSLLLNKNDLNDELAIAILRDPLLSAYIGRFALQDILLAKPQLLSVVLENPSLKKRFLDPKNAYRLSELTDVHIKNSAFIERLMQDEEIVPCILCGSLINIALSYPEFVDTILKLECFKKNCSNFELIELIKQDTKLAKTILLDPVLKTKFHGYNLVALIKQDNALAEIIFSDPTLSTKLNDYDLYCCFEIPGLAMRIFEDAALMTYWAQQPYRF